MSPEQGLFTAGAQNFLDLLSNHSGKVLISFLLTLKFRFTLTIRVRFVTIKRGGGGGCNEKYCSI